MAPFKDSYAEYSDRIRSPLFGAIVISFLIFNWRPLWFLIFADEKVIQKFEFFDSATSAWTLYTGPIVIGLVAAVGLPWIKLLGSWIASEPVMLLKSHQAQQVSLIRIENFDRRIQEENARKKHEEAIADRAVSAAKRQKEALEIGGTELAKSLEGLIERSGDPKPLSPIEDIVQNLGPSDRFLLNWFGKTEGGGGHFGEKYLVENLNEYSTYVSNSTYARMKVDTQTSLDVLQAKGLVIANRNYDEGELWFYLTSKGYSVLDALIADATE